MTQWKGPLCESGAGMRSTPFGTSALPSVLMPSSMHSFPSA